MGCCHKGKKITLPQEVLSLNGHTIILNGVPAAENYIGVYDVNLSMLLVDYGQIYT